MPLLKTADRICYGHQDCRILALSDKCGHTFENADSLAHAVLAVALSRAYPELWFDTEDGIAVRKDAYAISETLALFPHPVYECFCHLGTQPTGWQYDTEEFWTEDKWRARLQQLVSWVSTNDRLEAERKAPGVRYGGNGTPRGRTES